MRHVFAILVMVVSLSACSTASHRGGEMAISRVDDCTCFKSVDGQQLMPWELSWDDPEALRRQFSHCVCQAHIDLKQVEDPRRYVVPGTVVK